ncbi:hypothetical protein AB0P36_19085 [Streptomyces flavidovirens]|uniref:hypothetical protein n=1 Tax=Streptomyces flavidovirens TaxID=67298 RepID=UPI003449C761
MRAVDVPEEGAGGRPVRVAKSKGYGVLDVRRDRQGLDLDKDGKACGKGDFRKRR